MRTIEEIQKELEEEKLRKSRSERISKIIKNIFIDIVVISVILFLVVTGVSAWNQLLHGRQFSASEMFISFILTCLIAAIYFIIKYVWFDFMEYLLVFCFIVGLSCIEYATMLLFVLGIFDKIITRWAFILCLLITTVAMALFQPLKEEKS